MVQQLKRKRSKTSASCIRKTSDRHARQFVTNIMLCTKKSTSGSKFLRTILEGHQLNIRTMLFMKFSTIWINAECGLKKMSTSFSAQSWINSWQIDSLRVHAQSPNARTKMHEAISAINAEVFSTRLTCSILAASLQAALPKFEHRGIFSSIYRK